MALKDHAHKHKWLSTQSSQHELEEKQAFFEEKVGKVVHIYHKNTFCSGFLADNVIAEIEGAIYAVTDDYKVWKRENKSNATWEPYEIKEEKQ